MYCRVDGIISDYGSFWIKISSCVNFVFKRILPQLGMPQRIIDISIGIMVLFTASMVAMNI